MSAGGASNANDVFALLREIEARSRQNALGLPQQVEVRRTWSGIGYRIEDLHLVTPLAEIREIFELPPLTRVPGAAEWVLGIANVRGMLLPIMDLRGFVTGACAELGRRSRVIVLRFGELAAGLLVDEVFGMRHFFDEEYSEAPPAAHAPLAAYLRGAYEQGTTPWGVFSMHALADDPRFMEVAARGQAQS